jgi:putative transposase
MIERDGEVSVKRQAQLLDLSRSSVYYVARGLPERDLKLMRILDELHLKWPFYGARKLARELQKGRSPACDDADSADGHGDDLP